MDKFNQVIRDYGAKAGLTGATIAVGSMLLFGQTGNIKVFNTNLPHILLLLIKLFHVKLLIYFINNKFNDI